MKYVDPSGHETQSAAEKQNGKKELTPDQQALQDLVNEQNQNGGHDSSDQQTIKKWAEDYKMDYDDLGVQPKDESGSSSWVRNLDNTSDLNVDNFLSNEVCPTI